MASITFIINNKGFLSYKTTDPHLQVVGEFFVNDVGYMPHFARALLTSPFDEECQLTATLVITYQDTVTLQSINQTDLTLITINKAILMHIIYTWEEIVKKEQKLYFTQEIMFKEIVYELMVKPNAQSLISQGSFVYKDYAK